MTVGTYWVGTPEFRKAVQAVRPHADKTRTGGDGSRSLNRIRMLFDPDAGFVRMMATNTVTTGVAVVQLTTANGQQMDLLDAGLASSDAKVGPAVADIAPDRAAKLLGFFPASSSDEGLQLLRLDVEDTACTVTDCGGLMDGESLTISRPPDGEGFPDVWEIVKRAAYDAQSTPQPKPLTVLGEHLAKFAVASHAYERPLTVVPSGSADARGFLVKVSRNFLGLVSSSHNDDDSLSKREADWLLWLDRFAGKRQVTI